VERSNWRVGTSLARVLWTRGGSGQGLVGRLSVRCASLSVSPLEDFEGVPFASAATQRDMIPRSTPTGTGGEYCDCARLVQFSGHARQRQSNVPRAGQCGRESMCRRRRGAAVHEHEFDAFVRTLRKGLRVSTRWLLLRTSIRNRTHAKRQTSDVHADDSLGALFGHRDRLVMERCSAIGDPLARCVSMTTIEGNGSFRRGWCATTRAAPQHLSPRSVPRPPAKLRPDLFRVRTAR